VVLSFDVFLYADGNPFMIRVALLLGPPTSPAVAFSWPRYSSRPWSAQPIIFPEDSWHSSPLETHAGCRQQVHGITDQIKKQLCVRLSCCCLQVHGNCFILFICTDFCGHSFFTKKTRGCVPYWDLLLKHWSVQSYKSRDQEKEKKKINKITHGLLAMKEK
jgi:hypothetical protein